MGNDMGGDSELKGQRYANRHLNEKKAKQMFQKKKQRDRKYKKKAKRAIEQKMIKQGMPVPGKSPNHLHHAAGGCAGCGQQCQNSNSGMGMNGIMGGGMNNMGGMGMQGAGMGMQGGGMQNRGMMPGAGMMGGQGGMMNNGHGQIMGGRCH